jgi:hypothetical protein
MSPGLFYSFDPQLELADVLTQRVNSAGHEHQTAIGRRPAFEEKFVKPSPSSPAKLRDSPSIDANRRLLQHSHAVLRLTPKPLSRNVLRTVSETRRVATYGRRKMAPRR